MVSLMQNEGETDNRKAMFMVSFYDFSAPSKSRMFILLAFSLRIIYYATLYWTHAILTLLTMD